MIGFGLLRSFSVMSAAAVLCGCVATGGLNANKPSIDQVPAQPLAAPEDDFFKLQTSTPESGVKLRRVIGTGLIAEPRLEAYLNDLLTKIRAGMPQPPGPAAKVYLAPDYDLDARSLSGGAIFVSPFFLSQFKTEDELAYLLAHEYAHVVFRHSARSDTSEWVDRIDNLVKTGLAVAGQLNQEVSRAVLWSEAGYHAARTVLLPSWSRAQEEDADLLAADLVIRAGYNVDSAMRFFDILESVEKQHEERRKAERERLAAEAKTDIQAQMMFDFNAMVEDVSREHDMAAKRSVVISNYLERVHPDRPAPVVREAPLRRMLDAGGTKAAIAMSRAAHAIRASAESGGKTGGGEGALGKYAQSAPLLEAKAFAAFKRGDAKTADRLLAAAANDPNHPISVYRQRVNYAVATSNIESAKQAVAASEAAFGESKMMLPSKIQIAHRQNDKTAVTALQLACRTTEYRTLVKLCDAAAEGKSL